MSDERDERAERVDLYRVLVEEYRFETQLAWDRTKNALTMVLAILGTAAGLLKLEGSRQADWGVMALFLLGSFSAKHAVGVIERGHEYYRIARDRMVHAGERLDLGEFTVLTTEGARDARDAVNTEGLPRKRRRPPSIMERTIRLLRCMLVVGLLGAVLSAYLALKH